MGCHCPYLGSASDWMKQLSNQSEAVTRSEYWQVIGMEFLCSLLRRHFAGKPSVPKCRLFYQARQVNKWSLLCFLYQPSLFSVFFSVFCSGDSPHYLKKKLHCIWEIKGFFEIKRTREKTPRTKNEKWENINSIALFECLSQFDFSRWS